jgi:hypothetical protein
MDVASHEDATKKSRTMRKFSAIADRARRRVHECDDDRNAPTLYATRTVSIGAYDA